ncbi:uncharacterized membrane protein YsdA (DUF1294 family) [Pseudofulvimonas gallinarii]|uniref:Uncharacterized membrane protein YsdA (DUF1294 family) n=2 Tax=Pseudofulvimonas gallinarii TaxID=634155 RepID=A0A4R3LQ41_9GAMM|nr:uncharacterized membrane protein YsdA (DUF1294 family) [Pseudofulvimonas gallinarii]
MVRMAGRITDWDDGRGFGFVVPNGGGEKAFLHIKAFERGSRRPISGDPVSYVTGRDERGRLQAEAVRHIRTAALKPDRRVRFPRLLLGVVSLLCIAAMGVFAVLPHWLVLASLFMSLVVWLLYFVDKRAALAGRRRTPESSLHLGSLLGGWPGALIAQRLFHHKTAKREFQTVFWMTVILNIAAVGWLVYSGVAARIAAALP